MKAQFMKVYFNLFDVLPCFEDVYLFSWLLDRRQVLRKNKDGWYRCSRDVMEKYFVGSKSNGNCWSYETFNNHFKKLEEVGLIRKDTKSPSLCKEWWFKFNDDLINDLITDYTDDYKTDYTNDYTNDYRTDCNSSVIIQSTDNHTPDIKTPEEEERGTTPINIPSSKTDDISFLSKSIDRILGISGAYTNDEIYRYSSPLFERGVGVEDMILVFDWAYDVLGGKGYSVTPKSCFNEEKFTGKLTDAKRWKNNNPDKVTDVSALYLEWDKKKNPDKYVKQQEEEEKEKIIAKHRQEIDKRREGAEYAFDRLCSFKGWGTSQSNKGYFVDLIVNSPHYSEMQRIFDAVKSNPNISMFEFENMLKQ